MAYQSEIEKLQRRYDEKPEQWFAALADAHRKAGDLEKALRIVQEGIEARPNYVSGHIVHGRCLVDQGGDGEARAVFEQVLTLDAENIIALRMLGEIGERTGDFESAQRWLGRLLEVDPMNDDGRELLERIESGGVAVGQGEEAPVDFAGEPELPVETAPSVSEPATAAETAPASEGFDGEGPTVEMSPPFSALAEDTARAEPEPAGLPDPAAAPPFDPAEPVDAAAWGTEETERVEEPATPDSAEPFVLRQGNPFGTDEDDAASMSFDDVMPENEGGVFGVTEIDFESDQWKHGSRTSSADLPVGDQEVSLDDLPPPTGDSGLPVGDLTISLDDIDTRSSGFSDLPAGDREISLDEITNTPSPALSDIWDSAPDEDPEDQAPADWNFEAEAAGDEASPSTGPGARRGEVTQPVEAVDVASLMPDRSDSGDSGQEGTETGLDAAAEPEEVGMEPAGAWDAVDETGALLDDLDAAFGPVVSPAPDVPDPQDASPDFAVTTPPEAGPTVPIPVPDLARLLSMTRAPAGRPAAPEIFTDESDAEMVTETLAEVYAKQGLTAKAREVYRQLIEANPGDPGLRERFEALGDAAAAVPEEEAAVPSRAYLAAQTGGTSVRVYLSHVLAARPGAVAVMAEEAGDPVATLPPEPSPLELAFGAGGDGEPPAGEEGESALASVFESEEPEALAPPTADQGEKESGMSFDQFFRTETGETQAAAEEKPGDDEDFKNWLQGLKS